MIKTAQFIQLSLLMLLLFLLFQFSSYSITFYQQLNEKDGEGGNPGNTSYEIEAYKKDILVITGDNIAATDTVTQTLAYMKRGYRISTDLFSVAAGEGDDPEIIIFTSETMKDCYDIRTLRAYLERGVTVIFAVLPAGELDDAWMEVLGIERIRPEIRQEGVLAFEGFLLGGKQDYKEFDVEAPFIKSTATCKTYMVGYKEKIVEGTIREFDYMYDIVWRNRYQNSQIFVVNGKLFEKYMGSGILSAIFAQIYPSYIYPVVNAKALIINNAPYLSRENQEEMMKRYSRNAGRLLADLILPNIISISMTYNCVPTLYGISSFDSQAYQNTYNTSFLPILNENVRRIGGEIGISAYDRRQINIKDKLLKDINRFEEVLGFDKISSIHSGETDQDIDELVSEARSRLSLLTVVTGGKDGVADFHEKDGIVYLPVISRGFAYTEEEYFRLSNMATALGIINHEADMKRVVFPESMEDDWTHAMMNLSSMLDSYWNVFDTLEGTNISELGRRVTTFLKLQPDIYVDESRIQVSIGEFDGPVYFILRTRKSIADIENGTFLPIEKGSYMITADKAELTITLSDEE